MNNYETALKRKSELETLVDAASMELKKFPTGAMGLTPDSVRNSSEYKTAKSKFDTAFKNLRAFNGPFVKRFKKEIIEARNARRKA